MTTLSPEIDAEKPERPVAASRLRHLIHVAPGSVRLSTELGVVHREARDGGNRYTDPDFVDPATVPSDGLDPFGEFDCSCCADHMPAELELPLGHSCCDCGGRRITGFSNRSRARMMYRLSTLDWAAQKGIPEMVTLTYPREFPADGPTVKRHLDRFYKRWECKWKDRPRGVWKMEFQQRGAPHFHLYVFRPHVPWREFLNWARRAWFEIVGSGDLKHLEQGVRLDRQFVAGARSVKKIAGYFAKHNAKHSSKHYQNVCPAGFERVGRFWGVWGIAVQCDAIEISTQQFIEMRRALVRLQRNSRPPKPHDRRMPYKKRPGRKRKAPSRLIGVWTLSHQGYELAATLLSSKVDTGGFGAWIRRLEPDPVLV